MDNEEVRKRMVRFIKTHYAKTLGKDIELVDTPEGRELLHQKYCNGIDITKKPDGEAE